MPENLTPAHLRCNIGMCPSIYRLEDGTLALIGRRAPLDPSKTRSYFGTPIADNEEAVIISPDLLDSLKAEWIREVVDENTRLRAALAQSDQPCVYCTLPAEEWSKCQHGFPGCARADDAMGCPELGARMEEHRLRDMIKRRLDCDGSNGIYDAKLHYDLTEEMREATKDEANDGAGAARDGAQDSGEAPSES